MELARAELTVTRVACARGKCSPGAIRSALREGEVVPRRLERGGTYVRARLRGEPPVVYERIPAPAPDASRPSIEHYRRRDEIELLLRVR